MIALEIAPIINAGALRDDEVEGAYLTKGVVFSSLRVYAVCDRSKILAIVVFLLSIAPAGMQTVSPSESVPAVIALTSEPEV